MILIYNIFFKDHNYLFFKLKDTIVCLMKKAVLLVNLGSPSELSKNSVRKYLNIFLSDDYVVDIPKFLQQLILKLFILPFRPKQTLHAYSQIWTDNGSPLIISTFKIKEKLSKETDWHVEVAMRYEEPSI